MKKLDSITLTYKNQDPQIAKMFENYNRILRAVGLFLTVQFFLLIAVLS